VHTDVVVASAASPNENRVSLVVLHMAEITLIEALSCQQVITEAERILSTDLPRALSAFRLPVDRFLRVVPDPTPEHLPPRAC
jgi:hypothetical protein